MRLAFFVIGCVFVCSCQEEDTKQGAECPGHSTCSYWFTDSDGAFPDWGVPADKNVFVYEVKYNDEPMIADDELTESILIYVPKTVTEFNFGHLAKEEVRYTRSCFCGGENSIKIEQGVINGGQKSETEWVLSGDVTFKANDQDKHFIFTSQKFVKK